MRRRTGGSPRPARAWLSRAMPSRIASAARQARTARCFCFSGAPQKAMTLSPMNLSTVPSSASTAPATMVKCWFRSAAISAADLPSEIVE